jgi:hypothetical protein
LNFAGSKSNDRCPSSRKLRLPGFAAEAVERINRVTVAMQATASLNRLFDGMFLLTNAR